MVTPNLLHRAATALCIFVVAATALVAADGDEAKSDDVAKAASAAPENKVPAKSDKSPNNEPRRRKSASAKNPMPAFTPEREAAAMTFVRQHHPEVADLLERLKANHPVQYRRAASGLFRASERLAQWKDRDPARYELELKAWKIQSRIQLLLARSTMADESNDKGDAELRAVLKEQADVKLELRQHERNQLAKRLAQADEDIARLKENGDAAIDQQLTSLKKGIDQSRRNMKARASGKNAKAKNSEAKPAK